MPLKWRYIWGVFWQKFCFPSEMELAKLEEVMNEASQLSPKAKGIKNSTVRRKKRPLPHMRSQHLDEALSPVTTPTDEDVIQRIKQVAGSTQTRSPDHHHMPGGLALYSVSKLLLIISFVYDTQIFWQFWGFCWRCYSFWFQISPLIFLNLLSVTALSCSFIAIHRICLRYISFLLSRYIYSNCYLVCHFHSPSGCLKCAQKRKSKVWFVDCFVNVFSSLVLLVFLNMMLFYKLWMLEYSAQSLTTWQSLRLQERYRDGCTFKTICVFFCV